MPHRRGTFAAGSAAADAERHAILRMARISTMASVLILALFTFGASLIVAQVFEDLDALGHAAMAAGVALVLCAIPAVVMYRTTMAYQFRIGSKSSAHEQGLTADARRRDYETRLARALEMVDDEPDAFDVIRRGMSGAVPDGPVELLLADNSHAHLERVIVASPDDDGPGCTVDSPDHCVAARRAQTQVFHDSEALDACPMLRGRERGACSAVCVPVSVLGRTVGVLHTVGDVGGSLESDQISNLETLSNQAGNRIGLLRVMAETRVQASTDGLTGLMNRRTLETRMRTLRSQGVEVAFVMADLDHFKELNDTHGHEIGDRALRIFSKVLTSEVRSGDLACRYGGEEFALVLPGADAQEAVEVIERVRAALLRSTARGDAPRFTASFGIARSADAADPEDLVRRADQSLFHAKDAGRDRTCLDGFPEAIAPALVALP